MLKVIEINYFSLLLGLEKMDTYNNNYSFLQPLINLVRFN